MSETTTRRRTADCDGCGELLHEEQNRYEVIIRNPSADIEKSEVLCINCLDSYPDLPLQ